MSTSDRSASSRFHAVKGAVKRSLGWLTADREVEAEGAVEAEQEAEPSASEVKQAKREIKAGYGETLSGPVELDEPAQPHAQSSRLGDPTR